MGQGKGIHVLGVPSAAVGCAAKEDSDMALKNVPSQDLCLRSSCPAATCCSRARSRGCLKEEIKAAGSLKRANCSTCHWGREALHSDPALRSSCSGMSEQGRMPQTLVHSSPNMPGFSAEVAAPDDFCHRCVNLHHI